MTWVVRAIRFRHRLSVAFLVLSLSVTAGCVVVVTWAESEGGDDAAVLPFVLLGAVAFAQLGAASVDARRHELALAELHGQFGRRLLWSALVEPVSLLGAGVVGGLLGGWLLARLALRSVHGVVQLETTARALLVGTTAGVLEAVVVLVVVRRAMSRPLDGRLRSTARRAAPPVGASFGTAVVLLGAFVAVYETRAVGAGHRGWLAYLSPTLVGLAAARIGVWLWALLVDAAGHAEYPTRTVRRLVTVRRLARTADRPELLRVVVAAVVVASVGGSAWVGAESWRDSTARMRAGGALTYEVPAGPFQAYAASHHADPDGRWLMAMSAAPGATDASSRGVFVDAQRWTRVVGDFYGGTPIAQVGHSVARLAAAASPVVARGRTFTVTLSKGSARRALLSRPQARLVRSKGPYGGYNFHLLSVVVGYVDSNGDDETLEADLDSESELTPAGPGRVAFAAPIRVPGVRRAPCAGGCSVTSVEVQGITHGGLQVTGLTFGSQQLTPVSRSGLAVSHSKWVDALETKAGLRLVLGDPFGAHPLLAWPRPDPLPVLTTARLALERQRRAPVASGLDGVPLPVRRLATVTVLPLVGRQGVLLDLATALRGAGGQIPATQSYVVARSGTPPEVITRLRQTGAVGAGHTVEQARVKVDRAGAARGTVLYLWVALFCLLVAAISVVSTVTNQRQERVVEAASLRLVGIGSAEIRRAHRDESLILGVVVLAIAAAGGWACCRALLDVLPLADPGAFGVPFDAHPPATAVLGLAAVAGLFVGAVSFLGLRTVSRSAPPRLLREEG